MQVGVGLLLSEKLHNAVRNIELELLLDRGVSPGLIQPPHITVKRPFEINPENLTKYIGAIDQIAGQTKTFTLAYDTPDSFPDGSTYIHVNKTTELIQLHETLMTASREYGSPIDKYEGDNAVFHTSVSIGVKYDSKALHDLRGAKLDVKQLGVFINHDSQWIIISLHSIGQK